MHDLDEVISKVERVELSTQTRQRHLARLHALQTGRADIGSAEMVGGRPASRRRSQAAWSGGLAAVAVAVVAGASTLLVPAYRGAVPTTPGAGAPTVVSSASSPTDRPTAQITTTGNDATGLTGAAFSKELADILNLTDTQAGAVAAQLNELGRHGGVDPTSSRFIQIAAGIGVTPAQLTAAIQQIKTQLATGVSTGAGQPKDPRAKAAGTQAPSTTSPSGALAKSTTQNPGQNLLTTAHSVDLLASALGLSRQKSAELARKLADLEHGTGLDPGSSSFQTIARNFGATPDQLAGAIDQIKRTAN
jgi:hypothetical protein